MQRENHSSGLLQIAITALLLLFSFDRIVKFKKWMFALQFSAAPEFMVTFIEDAALRLAR